MEGAGGYESNDLPFMRCLPLFSSVGTEMSSLLCAFSFRHPCGAGRWGEATAPCSHPGGSRSDSHRRADMESTPTKSKAKRREDDILPYRYLNISSYPNQKQSFHFAVRRNFTPKAHHFPLAENITRRRRISLCNPPQGAVAPWGTAKRWMRCAILKTGS